MAAVEKKMPRRVKRKRPIVLDDGSRPGGMEEYYDYIFPVGGQGRLVLAGCLCVQGCVVMYTHRQAAGVVDAMLSLVTVELCGWLHTRWARVLPLASCQAQGSGEGASIGQQPSPAIRTDRFIADVARLLTWPGSARLAWVQDEAAAAPNLKLLEMAHKWKRQKMGGEDGGGAGGVED